MKQNTRDWLLEKLLFASRENTEQLAIIDRLNTERQRILMDTNQRMRGQQDTIDVLMARIKQMAPERQFKIVWAGPGRAELAVDSIASANGVTTISVRRA